MAIDNEVIEGAKEKLGELGAELIAKDLDIEEWDSVGLKGRSIFKKENTPSFIWNKKANCFHCFSTGRNYGYLDHLLKFKKLSFKDAVKELLDLVGEEYKDSDFKTYDNDSFFNNYKFPKDEPENDRKVVEEYLSKRGISVATMDFCDIKQDIHNNIAFQFKNTDGKLIATKYRVSKPATNKDKFKWSWQKDADNCPILYGVDKIDTTKPLLIVEGLVDRLACVEAGFPNTVSINGGANSYDWIEFNFAFLEHFKTIIIWADDDSSGDSMRKECVNRLGIHRCKIVEPTPEIKQGVADYFTKYNSTIDKVDANNVLVCCGRDSVMSLINGAKEVPNPRLKRLMDYEEIEIQDMPRISTGFKALDNIVFGMFEHTLTVLTGQSGNGKSTMISTLGLIAPLEAGEKVMIFSGEANGGTLLGNSLRPLAGRCHTLEWENKGAPNGYSVTNDAKAEIKKFYMDSIFNFDDEDEMVTGSGDILNTIEYAYKRYNVKHIVLDNLMCISTLEMSDDDKYSSQIKFTLALKRLTRKYPLNIILVAHPRKPQAGQTTPTLYDIAGASEIVNLADRGFALQRLDSDDEGYHACLTVVKDRQIGGVGRKAKLYFDKATLRLYTDQAELEKKYAWEKTSKIQYIGALKEKIVANRKYTSESTEVTG